MKKLNQRGASKNSSAFLKLSDAILIQMIENSIHKNEAFTVLRNKYHPEIERICWHNLHNRSWVEDAEEDTWVSFLTMLYKHSYKETSHFDHLVHRIAHNCSVQIYKREKLHRHEDIEKQWDAPIEDTHRNSVEWDDRFYHLPKRLREILHKRGKEAKTVKETAEEMGVDETTVRNGTWRALKRMKSSVMGDGL